MESAWNKVLDDFYTHPWHRNVSTDKQFMQARRDLIEQSDRRLLKTIPDFVEQVMMPRCLERERLEMDYRIIEEQGIKVSTK